MATAARWTLYSIATLVAYIMLIAAANTASAAPAKGEIRALIKDIVYEAYPQCVANKRQTEGDDSCFTTGSQCIWMMNSTPSTRM